MPLMRTRKDSTLLSCKTETGAAVVRLFMRGRVPSVRPAVKDSCHLTHVEVFALFMVAHVVEAHY